MVPPFGYSSANLNAVHAGIEGFFVSPDRHPDWRV